MMLSDRALYNRDGRVLYASANGPWCDVCYMSALKGTGPVGDSLNVSTQHIIIQETHTQCHTSDSAHRELGYTKRRGMTRFIITRKHPIK